jgi:alanyl-tRNA synthetase
MMVVEKTSNLEHQEQKNHLNASDLKRNFNQHWSERGFQVVPPISIIPPASWEGTLFINSAFIRYFDQYQKGHAITQGLVTNQPCIKVGFSKISLEEMMTKDGFLTHFEQISIGIDYSEKNLQKVIEGICLLLWGKFSMEPEKIYIGIPDSRQNEVSIWQNAGVKTQNIIVSDKVGYAIDLRKLKVKGEYTNIIFDRGAKSSLACHQENCQPGCHCERFLELGDLGIIDINGKKVLDHAFGLERIQAMQNGLEKVADLPWFKESIALGTEQGLGFFESMTIADHLRTILLLASQGIEPGNKKQPYILRLLLRRVLWNWPSHTPEQFDYSAKKYLEIFSDHFLGFSSGQHNFLKFLTEEKQNLDKLVIKAKKIIKRLLKTKPLLDPSDLQFLYETHGVPFEISLKIRQDLVPLTVD